MQMNFCWLVRHGQSQSNAGEMTVSAGATGLTGLGQRQAEAWAGSFTAVPDLIVCSPFVRTQETAAPFCARFPLVPVEIWPVQEFSGLAPARYEQTDQLQRRAWVHAFWSEPDPHFVEGPGAESFAMGLTRVAEFMAQLRAHPAERIVVFTHGRFLQLMLWLWLVQDLERAMGRKEACRAFFQTVRVGNTAVITGQEQDGQLFLSPPNINHLTPELHP
jgi:broad specificity phosphatase PhoE